MAEDTINRIERVLIDYLEGVGLTVEDREGEWFLVVEGHDVSLTALAVAINR